METILYLVHTNSDGSLPKVALETLTAAKDLAAKLAGSKLIAGLIGEKTKAAADAIAGCGAVKFLTVEGPDFGASRYASDAFAAEKIVKAAGATLVLAPATSRFARAIPGAAKRAGGSIDTHVSAIQADGGKVQISRWFYRQRMLGIMSRSSRPWFLLVDPGVFEAATEGVGSAAVEKVEAALPESCRRTQVVGIESPSAGTQTIRPDAKLLFVAGAGWTKKQSDGQTHLDDAGKHILGFLAKSQASLGSSKSLVDLSTEGGEVLNFMSHLNQVGQTGSTPRHPKGLATCCHGEEPHVVGWRFINERRAVNLDPNCGWAQGKADVLYVADAFKVMEKLNELLVS
ncbi:MAG: electron transfer flavoprotein subunit alpha [Candidatus Omnitrophota bacterium]